MAKEHSSYHLVSVPLLPRYVVISDALPAHVVEKPSAVKDLDARFSETLRIARDDGICAYGTGGLVDAGVLEIVPF